MKTKQHGFTMIELIVVIVILGILSAVALPRFTNISRDARIAKLNAARAAVLSASSMIHGVVLVRGGVADTGGCAGAATNATNTTALAGTVCTEHGLVSIINGYPQANLPGILSAAGLTSVFPATAAGMTSEGYGSAAGGAVIASVLTVQVTGGANAATCSFTYRPSTTGTGGAPIITVANPAGC